MTGDERRREDAIIGRGRAQMQAIVGFMIVLTLAGVTAGIAAGESVPPRIVRLVTTFGLAIAVARGVRWATILGGLVMVGSTGLCVLSVQTFAESAPPIAFAFAAGGVLSAAAAFQLLFSPHLKAFQAFQRESRERAKRPAHKAEPHEYAERHASPRKAKKRKTQPSSAEPSESHAAAASEAEGSPEVAREAQKAEVERRAEADRQARRAEADREARRAEADRLKREGAERLARVRAEQAALATVEREKEDQRLERLRPLREATMRGGSALVTLAVVGWCVLAWRSTGSHRVGLAPVITAGCTLVAAVLANLGLTYGRFALAAIGGMGVLAGLLGSSLSGVIPSAPWLEQARIAILSLAALGTAALAWGLERGAARTVWKTRVLHASLGIVLGGLTMAWFTPELARCTSRQPERLAGCHTLSGNTCQELPGCRPIDGSCLSQCEFARSEAACPQGCVWHDRRCTYPSCNFTAHECHAHAECTMKNGYCTPSCEAAATQNDCEIAGFACRWVDCAGEPRKACAEFAYDECPEHACEAMPR